MSDEILEEKFFGAFERQKEFIDVQQSCLFLDLFGVPTEEDDRKEVQLFNKLSNILHEYQEQSYLLDPFLENLVVPVVECLRSYAKASVTNHKPGSSPRVERLADLLYNYVKFRGYKTIIRFFPHEIEDLSIALEFLLAPDSLIRDASQWTLRYVVLLWLSLICMIPFDLTQFDDTDRAGYTAAKIESSAKAFLGKAGLERDGAVLVLSRLYMRRDTSFQFDLFLKWTEIQLNANADVFTSIGLLQILCEFTKSGPMELVQPRAPQLLAIANGIYSSQVLASNATFRKFKTKLISRIALRLLPTMPNIVRHRGPSLVATGLEIETAIQDRETEVPEGVEDTLEQLFNALQDRDTIVRWSAAKGVARISERLPADFLDQVLEAILGLFSIHSVAAAALYDLPAVAESTWHGACLACAEIARRGLIVPERLSQLIGWLSKALYFDIRKGAHSIGSNVRDASAYVLWALARTHDPSTLDPHAMNLAQRLMAVALYDREIHIRRAASAAFQEHVGRNNLFPHGIDVLVKTDFYAISIRRNAFLTAAPQVAKHKEYRTFLLDHVVDVILRHWDSGMRELGSQSLRLICEVDLPALAPQASVKSIRLLESIDVTDLHGGLLALSEISLACHDSGDRLLDSRIRDNFRALSKIPFDVVVGPRNAIVTAAACRLISITLTLSEIDPDSSSAPRWREIVDYGLKHRSPLVQEAAANAMTSVSKLVDCSDSVKRYALPFTACCLLASYNTLIRELRTSSPAVQRSLGTVLGAIDYLAFSNALPEALRCLLSFVKPSLPPNPNIEARRNCYSALPKIITTTIKDISHHISAEMTNSIYDALINGLDDYSADERGDVGSWIRIACIQGLTDFSAAMICNASSISEFELYFPPLKFHDAIAKILKQSVERLDNVRQEAGECLLRILDLPLPPVHNGESWRPPGLSLLIELFKSETEGGSWIDGSWLFPKAVRLLTIADYRGSILAGLVLSLSSKTDSIQQPLATSLVTYVSSLPISSSNGDYDVNTLVADLIARAQSRPTSNTVVIPVLQTFNILLESGVLGELVHDSYGIERLQKLLSIITRNVVRLKSVPRIYESMKIVVNLLPYQPLFKTCVLRLADFLGHEFPSIRRDTAEYIYVMLQGLDIGRETDDVEEVLLETEWSSEDVKLWKDAAQRVVALLLV